MGGRSLNPSLGIGVPRFFPLLNPNIYCYRVFSISPLLIVDSLAGELPLPSGFGLMKRPRLDCSFTAWGTFKLCFILIFVLVGTGKPFCTFYVYFWFLVSFGAGILFKDFLNEFKIGGFKLGFWFAQQGSIYVFVILIFIYVYLMNNLDKKYGYDV